VGGHAVYIDARAMLPHIPVTQFPGQALAVELYIEGGIRGCEIGSVMFGKSAKMELVRLAIPRRVYTQSHIDYVVEVVLNVFKKRKRIRGMKITWQPDTLRHFTAHFEYV
jgi:tryptophanase